MLSRPPSEFGATDLAVAVTFKNKGLLSFCNFGQYFRDNSVGAVGVTTALFDIFTINIRSIKGVGELTGKKTLTTPRYTDEHDCMRMRQM